MILPPSNLIFKIILLMLITIGAFDLLVLIPAIIIDIKKKKFHWSKWVIISFVIALILFFIVTFIAARPAPPIDLELAPLISPTPTGNL